MRTALCQRLGIELPVFQAAIGGAAGPALASAVCRAGGLGTLGLSAFDGTETRARIRKVRQATDRPFVGNVVLAFDVTAQIDAMLSERIPIVSIFWGDPAPLVGRMHDAGALVTLTVGSSRRPGDAVDEGADIVVAQGWEAGGHVRGNVVDARACSGRRRRRSRPGRCRRRHRRWTRPRRRPCARRCRPPGSAPASWPRPRPTCIRHYRARILAASGGDTFYSQLFDGGWPDAPGRVLRNPTVAAWEAAGRPAPGARPGEREVIGHEGSASVFRYEAVTARSDFAGDIEAMSLWAGQGVGLVDRTQSAAEIVRDLVSEARSVMRAGGLLAAQ